MTATILSGKSIADELCHKIKEVIDHSKVRPGLAVILVGDDEASKVYVDRKKEKSLSLGMKGRIMHMHEASPNQILEAIQMFNGAPDIHGILVQLPLPEGFQTSQMIEKIAPIKDVDGIHPFNLGKLMIGEPIYTPCTPQGCIRLLHHYDIQLEGKRALVIGRSRIVGLPISFMLTHLNATVTLAHSHSPNLSQLLGEADIIVCAAGKAKLVGPENLKPSAIILDVGINRMNHAPHEGGPSIVGDVDFESVSQVVAGISPVPGGIGPMTVACLMYNTLKAAFIQEGKTMPTEFFHF
jgi:methylenetetrahydrofolate dehydrogenase (NADP+)/methenyltetrahydrofolate cyclohydrolase